MIALGINLNGDGALEDIDVAEADAIEVLVLEGGMDSGKPSVTLHVTLGHGHIVAQTSARLFCTAAKMIEAKYPNLFED